MVTLRKSKTNGSYFNMFFHHK